MECLNCGNCKQDSATYYCSAQNNFIIKEENLTVEKVKMNSGWKKGAPDYEKRRRKTRKDKDEVKKIG